MLTQYNFALFILVCFCCDNKPSNTCLCKGSRLFFPATFFLTHHLASPQVEIEVSPEYRHVLSHYDRNPAALQDSISVSIVSYDFTRLYLYVKPDHERNDSKDFTGQGVPTIKSVEKIVSFDVDRSEVVEAWGLYKISLAEAEVE